MQGAPRVTKEAISWSGRVEQRGRWIDRREDARSVNDGARSVAKRKEVCVR